MGSIPDWKATALERRRRQAEQIPAAWRLKHIPDTFRDCREVILASDLLTPEDLDITNTVGARKLLKKYAAGEWSVVAVVEAFCKRAALAHQLVNCLTEIMFEDALRQARELDEYFVRTGELRGPLHGVPLSLKDTHQVKGVDTTVGWVGLLGKEAKDDELTVRQYRELGAVVYVKTNIPQSLMMSDSYNHVWGQSVNALHRELISGGSSGGEGALVGSGGSILGIGTDIGGSIRIPAALQGLYGLCPSVGRVPYRESARDQKYVVKPVAGPICRSVSSVELFMEAYLSTEPWKVDPAIQPVPWREELAEKPRRRLKIGYIVDDGMVMPHPPVQRAVRDTIRKLKHCGHEVVEWDASGHADAYYNLWEKAVLADGGKRCADLCKLVNEPLIEGMLVGTAATRLDPEQRQELEDKIWEYQVEYLRKWKESGIDALIMPVTPWVGMRPKVWVKSQQYVGYTALWNLLDYAVLTVPVTHVSRELDEPDEAWKAQQGRNFPDQFNHGLYELDLFEGLPVNIQIVTGRFGEEKAVGVAKVIDCLP